MESERENQTELDGLEMRREEMQAMSSPEEDRRQAWMGLQDTLKRKVTNS